MPTTRRRHHGVPSHRRLGRGAAALLASGAALGGSGALSTDAIASPHALTGHCGAIRVNAHASCPFARNVVRAWQRSRGRRVTAYSPTTHVTYTLYCSVHQVVSCSTASGATVAFRRGIHVSAPPRRPPRRTVEGPGSYSHGTDAQFCSAHDCIDNFPNGSGYIVQCVDGEWSHSGGRPGACSGHGGESVEIAGRQAALTSPRRAGRSSRAPARTRRSAARARP